MKLYNITIFLVIIGTIVLGFSDSEKVYASKITLELTPEIIGNDSTIHIWGEVKNPISNILLKIDVLDSNGTVYPVDEIKLGTIYSGSNSYSELIRIYEIVPNKGNYDVRVQYGNNEKTSPIVYVGHPMITKNMSPNHQLEKGIILTEIFCKENRILVLRDNNKIACVFENTSEKMNWEILNMFTDKIVNKIVTKSAKCSQYINPQDSLTGYRICMSQ